MVRSIPLGVGICTGEVAMTDVRNRKGLSKMGLCGQDPKMADS